MHSPTPLSTNERLYLHTYIHTYIHSLDAGGHDMLAAWCPLCAPKRLSSMYTRMHTCTSQTCTCIHVWRKKSQLIETLADVSSLRHIYFHTCAYIHTYIHTYMPLMPLMQVDDALADSSVPMSDSLRKLLTQYSAMRHEVCVHVCVCVCVRAYMYACMRVLSYVCVFFLSYLARPWSVEGTYKFLRCIYAKLRLWLPICVQERHMLRLRRKALYCTCICTRACIFKILNHVICMRNKRGMGLLKTKSVYYLCINI